MPHLQTTITGPDEATRPQVPTGPACEVLPLFNAPATIRGQLAMDADQAVAAETSTAAALDTFEAAVAGGADVAAMLDAQAARWSA